MKRFYGMMLVALLLAAATAVAAPGAKKAGIRGTVTVKPTVIPPLASIAKQAEAALANAPTDGMSTHEEFSNLSDEVLDSLSRLPMPPVGPGVKLTIDRSAAAGRTGQRSVNDVTGPTLRMNFEGNLQGGSRPGDLMVAVGPNNVISTANSTIRIWSKTGTKLLTTDAGTFMNPANLVHGGYDPKVVYDLLSQRFIVLFDDGTNSTPGYARYCVAVSQSSDAMGGWYVYNFDMNDSLGWPTTNWSDFPGLGYDNTSIYMTGNIYNGSSFLYVKVRVADKSLMYLGAPVTYTDFFGMPDDGLGFRFTCKPAQSLSPTNTEYLLIHPNGGGGVVHEYRITGAPYAPVLESVGDPSVNPYGVPPATIQEDCPQTTVDPGDARTQDPIFRNGYLYLANQCGVSIGGGSVCAMQYLKLDAASATVVTQEIFGAPNTYYLYPAVTVDAAGTVYFALSRMSSTEYPTAVFTGRRLSDTATEPCVTLHSGVSAYWCNAATPRWGDYEGVGLDPAAVSDTAGAAWVDGNWSKGPIAWGSWIGQTVFFYHRIQGTVLADCDSSTLTAGDRSPVGGIKVTLLQNSTVMDSTVTDSTGAWSFGLLNDGTYDAVVNLPGADYPLDVIPGSGGTSQTKMSATDIQVTVSGASTASQISSGNTFLIVVPHAVPALASISPATYSSGEPGFTMTLTGTNFEKCATGQIDGASRATVWVNADTLQVSILASDIVSVGTHVMTVLNPTPAGGVSNGDTFTVHTPAPVFSGTPSSLAFGSHYVGTPTTDTIRVTNTGTADLVISGVTSDDSHFTISPTVGTIPRQTSLPFAVTFVPTSDSSWSGHVTFTHNAASSPDQFGVTGTGIDSITLRSASYADWANAYDAKFKHKSFPRKPDKVFFNIRLYGPYNAVNGAYLYLTFSEPVTQLTLRQDPCCPDTVPYSSLTVDSKRKSWTYHGSPVTLTQNGPTPVAVGVAQGGKPITVKYYWMDETQKVKTKSYQTTYTQNAPGLPKPNLINVGEELFPKGFGTPNPYFGPATPLVVGIPQGKKSAASVLLKKFADVLTSMIDTRSSIMHTGGPDCLDKLDNGTLIKSQLATLSPLKKNDILFAELLTLKLNIGASAAGKFPAGFGELTFRDPLNPSNPFNGKMLKNSAVICDSLLSCLTVQSLGVGYPLDSVVAFLHKVNGAFRDTANQKDTIHFLAQTVLQGVRKLGAVPFLHPTPGVVPATFQSPNVVNYDMPEHYLLYQNYPNPFNPTTTIQFALPEQSFVTLKVYNVLGQEVASLADNKLMESGTMEMEFDGANLASGVYFYHLIVNSVVVDDAHPDGASGSIRLNETKKMLLMR